MRWANLGIISRAGIGNWAFPLPNEDDVVFGGVVSKSGLREALLDTNPATALNPFLGFLGQTATPQSVKFMLLYTRVVNLSCL